MVEKAAVVLELGELVNGFESGDIEDVIAVSKPALRHRIVRNFKAEAEGRSIDSLIEDMVAEIK